MRFVPVKSIACQDLKALHRVRDRLVHSRTALINHTRGLLAEYGVVLPQGAKRFTTQVSQGVAEPLPASANRARGTGRSEPGAHPQVVLAGLVALATRVGQG